MSRRVPTTMRACVIDRFGGPDELHLADVPTPAPAPGEALVRVAYASVNPADWKSREGWLASFFDYRFPFIVGFDAAGVVAALGDGVRELAVGDRVVTASNQGKGVWGSYAEYVVSDVDRVARLPGPVDFAAAASLPTAGMTAWQAVFDVGAVKPEQRVLVHGGAGGCGSFAIQLARMAGAHVAATCSVGNIDYVRSLGAELAIDYRSEDVTAAVRRFAPAGLDLVVDTVGQGTLLQSIELVRRGGIVAPIGTLIANEPQPDPARAAANGVAVVPTMSTFPNQGRQLRALVAALAEGRIRPPALETLELAQAAEAHRRVQDGHVRGKLLLRVGGDEIAG
jgi:NADPH:quinone reductase-like Zn-dependent oxidoreductase